MTMQINAQHTIVILNGHRCEGFSDDADAISLPDIPLATVTRGADGQMYSASTADRGGEVMLKFLPVSTSAGYFLDQATRIMNGAVVDWVGSITNAPAGWSITLEGGVMTRFPVGPSLGKGAARNLDFSWEFELTQPNYTGARFGRPPLDVNIGISSSVEIPGGSVGLGGVFNIPT